MTRFNAIALATGFGLALAAAPQAYADQWNKRTILTINETIQVPGKVLTPGKYVMRLLDSPSNRHIVQVWDANEQNLQTTVLAIPNYRLQPTGDTQFGFYETPQGQPKAMRSWFYPGDNFGQEFVYPKSEAVSIASYANTNVPTTTAVTQEQMTSAEIRAVDRAGTEMELDRQTYTRADGMQPATPAPTPAPTTEVAQAAPVTQPEATPAPAEVPARLPETGSAMPLVGLVGMLSLGAAAVLRRVGR